MQQTFSSQLADFGWTLLCMPGNPSKEFKDEIIVQAQSLVTESDRIVTDIRSVAANETPVASNSTLRKLVRSGQTGQLAPFVEKVVPFHQRTKELISAFIDCQAKQDLERREELMKEVASYSDFLSSYKI